MGLKYRVIIAALLWSTSGAMASDEAKSRTFRLDYGVTLTGLPQEGNIRVWLPVPQTSEHQRVECLPTLITHQLAGELPARNAE